LVLPAGAVAAQSAAPPSPGQSASDPLAAAAKRVQDSKKDPSKTAHVWDNDNIPKAGHEISIVGSNEAVADGTNPAVSADANAGASPDAAAGGANPAGPASGPAPSQAINQADLDAKIQAQIASAKENVASMKTDLDLMQRTLVLDSQMYYSKPDYSNDRAGARKLTDEQAKIADKQQAIDEAEKKLAELQTLLNASPQNTPAVNRD
jgi:hypothetical protein